MNGGERHVELVSVAVTVPETETDLCLSSLIDITDRKKAEESSRLAEKLFNRSSEGIAITDARGHILTVNDAFTDMTGYALDEIAGKTSAILDSDRQPSDLHSRIRHGLETDGWWQGRMWRRQKDGEDHLTWLNVTAVRTDQGAIANTVYMLSDIRRIRAEKRRMEYFATHDELTDLANRSHFTDCVDKAIRERDGGAKPLATIGVLFMDLDNFKNINDTQGHDTGDRLLQAVAGRLRGVVRDEDTLARFGGDEFTLLIEHPDAEAAAIEAAKRILLAMVPPFDLACQTVFTTMSIGISLYPGDASDAGSLLKHSDIAMYQAKVRGKNHYQFYTEDLMQAARRRMRLENGLRAALVQNDFDLVFQPIVDLKTGRVQGAEALLRLDLDDGEAVSPEEFIPVAEQTGLISEISKWMCEMVFRSLSDWSRQGIRVPDITINLSGRDIQGGFASEHLAALARKHGVDPDNVTLELTEGVLMDNQGAALETLSELRRQGFRIAIDDFGSGYSSLAYMRTYPITTIKIDRAFLQNVDKDPADSIVLQAIIDLSNRLGLRVICEGVETPEQVTRLTEYGCSYGQGFYFYRPMGPDGFLKLIAEQDKNEE
jgi:diguanylate cyclase (GGDEF)-like protein/PAS domain S-box-containing protein